MKIAAAVALCLAALLTALPALAEPGAEPCQKTEKKISDEPAKPPPPDFDAWTFAVILQSALLHKADFAVMTFNDNDSEVITQSAILQRFFARWHFAERFDLGASYEFGLRNEALLRDDKEEIVYHPFKAASVDLGVMVWAPQIVDTVRLELWGHTRLNTALSARILTMSTLQAMGELVVNFSGETVMTFGLDAAANLDKDVLLTFQYGMGRRF